MSRGSSAASYYINRGLPFANLSLKVYHIRYAMKVKNRYTEIKKRVLALCVESQRKDALIAQYAKLNPAELKRQITKLQGKP